MKRAQDCILITFLSVALLSSASGQTSVHWWVESGKRWASLPEDGKTSAIASDIRAVAHLTEFDPKKFVMGNLAGLYPSWRETPREIQSALEEFVRASAARPNPLSVAPPGRRPPHIRGAHVPYMIAMGRMDPHISSAAEAVSLLAANATHDRATRGRCLWFLHLGGRADLLAELASKLMATKQFEDERLALLAYAHAGRFPPEIRKRLVAEVTTPTLGIEENIVCFLPRPGMTDDVADVAIDIARNAPQYALVLLRSLAEAPESVIEKHKQDLLDLSNQQTLDGATKAEINRALGRLRE